ncbi:unnamed protein product [Victoria cruziana]
MRLGCGCPSSLSPPAALYTSQLAATHVPCLNQLLVPEMEICPRCARAVKMGTRLFTPPDRRPNPNFYPLQSITISVGLKPLLFSLFSTFLRASLTVVCELALTSAPESCMA